jgi:GAF domain-containing protein
MFDFETRLSNCADLQSILDCVLDGGLALTDATFGNVKLVDQREGHLTIAAHCGFHREFLDFFQRVNANDSLSICGQALRERRAIISDVMLDEELAPWRPVAERAGFRSLQSTPIISSSGALIGIVATHFPIPHQPTEREMNAVRSLANFAADAIVRMRVRHDEFEDSAALLISSDWQPISSAPFNRDLELAVINYDGIRTLVFPCRRILGGWIKSETKARTNVRPTHWRDW